jgi:hypothetical protein
MNLETILKQKIQELSNYLISKSNNEDQIKLINNKLSNLKFYEIMLFVSFLQEKNIDTYINDFINSYKIEDTIEIRDTIKNYLEYFIQVNKILNKKE